MGTALKEGLPLKLVKHQGDAVSAAVVCGHKSGGSSLYHFELAGQFLEGIFNKRQSEECEHEFGIEIISFIK